MERARILYCGDPVAADTIDVAIRGESDERHMIVGNPTSLNDALEMISELTIDPHPENVIITRSNIDILSQQQPDGSDGIAVLKLIRRLGLPVKTILIGAEYSDTTYLKPDAVIDSSGDLIRAIVEACDSFDEPPAKNR